MTSLYVRFYKCKTWLFASAKSNVFDQIKCLSSSDSQSICNIFFYFLGSVDVFLSAVPLPHCHCWGDSLIHSILPTALIYSQHFNPLGQVLFQSIHRVRYEVISISCSIIFRGEMEDFILACFFYWGISNWGGSVINWNRKISESWGLTPSSVKQGRVGNFSTKKILQPKLKSVEKKKFCCRISLLEFDEKGILTHELSTTWI